MPWSDPQFWVTSTLFLAALLWLSRPIWSRSKKSGCRGCAASALAKHLDK